MNAIRWVIAAATIMVGSIGYPWIEPWEKGCGASSVALACILIIIGPAKERQTL